MDKNELVLIAIYHANKSKYHKDLYINFFHNRNSCRKSNKDLFKNLRKSHLIKYKTHKKFSETITEVCNE